MSKWANARVVIVGLQCGVRLKLILYLNNILFKKTDKTLLQFLRYILLGNISNFVDYSSLYVLTEFAGFHYALSAGISFVLGTIVNYFISIKWIFTGNDYSFALHFSLAFLVSIIGLLLNVLIILLLVEGFHIHYMFGKAIATIAATVWNFCVRKKWIFTKNRRIIT